MDAERLPKRLFYGDVTTGARKQGGQKRHYKDTLKNSLKQQTQHPRSILSSFHRTCTSRNCLVGHLRIHRTETDESVPEAPTYTCRILLNCPHCPHTAVAY
ncbi:unnamed protein product [Schistocephalus solidus]|uniref:Uncharacterized protein n=1 Tax=Schistocephalus solidus TaxID=70667 RepID=A0A183T8W0_SCHSO|nr:unnamed protein product [Schistocephalus solidus]